MPLYRRMEDVLLEKFINGDPLRRLNDFLGETFGFSFCWIITRKGQREPLPRVRTSPCRDFLESQGKDCPQEDCASLVRTVKKATFSSCQYGIRRLVIPLKAMDFSMGVLASCGFPPADESYWQTRIPQCMGIPEKEITGLRNQLWAINQEKLVQALPFIQEQIDTIMDHLLETYELLALQKATSLISSRLRIDEVLNEVMELCSRLFDADAYSLRLLDKETGILNVRASRGLSSAYLAKGPVKTGESIAGRVVEDKTPRIVPDIRRSRLMMQKELALKENFVSLVSIPIVHREKAQGVITLYSRSRKNPNAREINLLTTLASQVALAVENAHLFERTVELSTQDEMTGLHNYRFFRETLLRETGRAKRYEFPLSLAIFDIDDFKTFNDLWGHQVGDEVLRQVAGIMTSTIREIDILCRYGGEEFVLICPQTGKDETLALARRVQREIEKTIFQSKRVDGTLQITVSCGLATLFDDAVEADQLLSKADAALYAAKASGKNAVLAAGESF